MYDFFISTLGVNTCCIRSLIFKRKERHLEDRRGKHGNQMQLLHGTDEVRAHSSSKSKIESLQKSSRSEGLY